MSQKKVFEYSILRYVPDVAREEFINIGVVLYSRHLRFIGIMYKLNEARIFALDAQADITLLKTYVHAIDMVVKGVCDKNGIAGMDMHERFRWITANRSTIIQASVIHTGITDSAEETLQHLFNKYIV
jgi:hypothetical protein